MRIDKGNFGQQVANLTPESVQHQEVTSVAQAQQQGAQQVGAAGVNLGKSIAQIGADLHQHYTQMARLNAQQRVAEYSQFQQQAMDDIDSQVQQGQLDSRGAAAVYRQRMDELKSQYDKSPILDLDSEGKAYLDKGIGAASQAGAHRMGNYVEKLAWGEADRALDATAATFGQMAQQGVPLEQVRKSVSEFYDQNAAHYGQAGVEGKKQAMLKQVTVGSFRFRVEQAANSNDQLAKLKAEALGAGLDDSSLASIAGSIDTKINRNEARAIAAQNHRDALATRREVAAVHADDQMQKRIASGENPTEEEWQAFDSKTHGTSVGGKTEALQHSVVATQQVLALPPAQAQQLLDERKLQLQQHGGTALDYDVLNNTQRAVDKRKADLRENPQAVAAADSGQTLEPIRVQDANDNPGQIGQQLQQRMDNAQMLTQKYGPTAGKSLLTKDEMNDLNQYYDKLPPAQRVTFWRNLSASSTPQVVTQLARDMGGQSQTLVAVAAGVTSNGYKTALAVEKGNMLLNPTDGSAKVAAPKSADVTSAIAREYPNLTQAQIQRLVPVVSAAYVGNGGKTGPNESFSMNTEDLHAVIGEPVKVFGATMLAPVGADAGVFRDKIAAQVNRLPADQSAYVRNHMDNGSYTLIPDSAGNLRLINKDTNRAVTIGGKPFTVDMQ